MSKHIAFVFPGQGSQVVGMFSELADKYQQVLETFKQASKSLGYDLWDLVQEDPEKKLNTTQYTQPAVLTGSIAMLRIWRALGGCEPQVTAGHSLGEYSALVCADVLSFTDAVKLVAERGRIMQETIPEGEGAMAAIIGLEDDEVLAICDQASDDHLVSPANFNSPGQIVIAGHRDAVENSIRLAETAGAHLANLIPVSVPCHCDLLKPAAAEFCTYLENTPFQIPKMEVINNVDVAICRHPDDIREALLRQLYSPVRWVEIVQYLAEMNLAQIIECGPGKVLTGLNKRISREAITQPQRARNIDFRQLRVS